MDRYCNLSQTGCTFKIRIELSYQLKITNVLPVVIFINIKPHGLGYLRSNEKLCKNQKNYSLIKFLNEYPKLKEKSHQPVPLFAPDRTIFTINEYLILIGESEENC